ncbi:MAG: Crp/Fnr family transcriptional regulator [Pseudomonadota bacterium]|jgi:CRP/FNR family cyclic AMP-dependent transcriptional regulator|nr:Crp/Fnr family transcriptional regulator [Rubrivivax sp.]MCA3256995.1 Crp/Fnr family transcriptional regulator [Rubrivivax sp.]MCE2911925.1 Crp/Fnr family transcriptional regulator [Rubrivivax sp.]MCZ8029339.1 Crp/Fnr family transcriptional regulator [Rubrivivax sp.]
MPEPEDLIESAPMSPSLRELARRGVARRLRKGTLLIAEGDAGDALYIVLSGQLRAYSAGGDGREVTYGEYGPGEYVGEMSLDGGPRAADVEAVSPSVVVVVTRRTLEEHLRRDPAFAFELLAKVIRRARQATLTLKQIALNDVYGRLKLLLEEAAPAEGGRALDAAPSHLEMARRLGCSREMVSRVLKDLERGGYVEVGRRRLVLLKPLPAKW